MKYKGLARSVSDVDRALLLAAEIFRPDSEDDNAYAIKRAVISRGGAVLPENVVVLVNEQDEVVATSFLIDKLFFRGQSKLKGIFISSVCVAESERGKGLSRLLMDEVIAQSEKKRAAFAILIARRAVDHFYNKFGFWGLSQYSTIKLQLSNNFKLDNKLGISKPTTKELLQCNLLYEETYSNLFGACERNIRDWEHITWKSSFLGGDFAVFHNDKSKSICGYAVYSGSNIYEIASIPSVSLLEIVRNLCEYLSLSNVVIHVSPDHRIVSDLQGEDFSICLRQCSYGGHMVRVINHKILLNSLFESSGGELGHADSEVLSRYKLTGYPADWSEVSAGDSHRSMVHTFENTCLLMGANQLSSRLGVESFNIPLLDQD